MGFNARDFFEMGNELGKGRTATEYAAEGVADSFKEKRKSDYEIRKLKEIESYKNQLPMNEKERAQTDLLKSQSAWMKGISGMPEEEGLVLDSVGKSGPRYVNADARLKQKTLEGQASQLPKLDRALVAVQSLKTQYQRSLSPTSIDKNSNPFVGFLKKGIQGASQNIGSMSGTNPEMNRYKANKEGFASLISKGGFMEAGVLTNDDIKRITNILPNEYSSQQEADIAWSEIESILSSARKQFESNSGIDGGIQNTGQSGQPNPMALREEAQRAIEKGADATKVSIKFKNMTGEDL